MVSRIKRWFSQWGWDWNGFGRRVGCDGPYGPVCDHRAQLQRRITPKVFKLGFLMGAGVALVVLIGSCSPQSKTISISSGTAGSFYHQLGDQIGVSAQQTVGISVQNQTSQGSRQNLERLLHHEVDFALVQLDVANQAMREGKVLAVAALAQESVHVVVRRDSGIQTLSDLQGKRVAIGAPGSGIRFTWDQLVLASRLRVQPDESSFDEAFQHLEARQIDAVVYVGSVWASQKTQKQFADHPEYTLVPIQPEIVNHLELLHPGLYESATLPPGTYSARPATPEKPTLTLLTSTVLVTRSDVNQQTVGLIVWSILSNARTYARFYPDLLSGDASKLLQQGLLYLHPAAADVYENGDPRAVLVRYWRDNKDLQSGIFLLVGSTVAGLLLQYIRRRQSRKTIVAIQDRINELRKLLPDHPQQALASIESLSQENRLRFMDGAITSEMYEQLRQKTQTFTDQCQALLDGQRTAFVRDTLLLLDEWQATLQTDPDEALKTLAQIKKRYREMLLADQVDIEAYIELVQLTLMSVMSAMPTSPFGTHTAQAWPVQAREVTPAEGWPGHSQQDVELPHQDRIGF